MRDTLKKRGVAALGLALVLSMLGTLESGALAAAQEPSAEPVPPPPAEEPAPTTTEAPPTTEAPAPAPTEAPATTVAPTTTTSGETAAPAAERRRQRRGPDPRWVDYGRCGRGITACHVAKAMQRKGKFQWRNGRWFRWGDDFVRGHPDATWTNYRRTARLLKIYLFAVAVAQARRALVNRWSGVARCESGGNWSINTGNGYYGGLQFSMGTWQAYGGRGMPHTRPAWYQATIADRVRRDSGLGHWPNCGRYYG